MKKVTKNITATCLMLVLLAASMFCCCLTETVQAETSYDPDQPQADQDQCCQGIAKNTGKGNTRECEHKKISAIFYAKELNILREFHHVVRLLVRDSFSSRNDGNYRGTFIGNNLLVASTFASKRDTPLYLQDSVFRL